MAADSDGARAARHPVVHYLIDDGKTIACREALLPACTTDLTKVTCKPCLKSQTARRRAAELGIYLKERRRELE